MKERKGWTNEPEGGEMQANRQQQTSAAPQAIQGSAPPPSARH